MQPFYNLPEADRIALTERAISEQRTVHERWEALGDSESSGWNARAALAAEWLSSHKSILDLGCGTMILEKYLDKNNKYIPSDVVKRDSRTIVIDYNLDTPPITPATGVACLGVIEYLYSPTLMLKKLSENYKACAISYCITDAPQPLEPRRAHAWVNDFSHSEFEDLVLTSGWLIGRSQPIDNVQNLWLLSSTNC